MHTIRRTGLLWALLAVCALLVTACGRGEDEGGGGGEGGGASAPGVTDTSVKLGLSTAFSGPASAYGVIARSAKAHFDWVNANGGVNGRKIELVSLDDGYDPAKTVQNTRRLITQEKVFALFNVLGTPPNLAIWDYVNQQKVPHLFVATGASTWGADIPKHPYTIGWQPDYQTEASAYGQYLKDEKPDAKVAVLYQNDGFGKDLLEGFEKSIQGSGIEIVARESYEVTDPTVAPQVKKLAGSGADTFMNITTPKAGAQAIGAVAKSDWRPLHILNGVAASKELVLKPVGFEAAEGIVSSAYLKDPSEEQFTSDPAVQEYEANLKKYAPRINPKESFAVYGWAVASTMVETLKQAGQDLTRESVMESARSLDAEIPLLLPGIRVQTDGEQDGYPIQQVRIMQFKDGNWDIGEKTYSAEGAGA